MKKIFVATLAIFAIVASMGIGGAALTATNDNSFTCGQLVAMGLLSESGIIYGTVYLPVGFIQIDGHLFDTSEEHETGTFYGDAYTPINRSETGLFVGRGY